MTVGNTVSAETESKILFSVANIPPLKPNWSKESENAAFCSKRGYF
jgi:hypothetical protein